MKLVSVLIFFAISTYSSLAAVVPELEDVQEEHEILSVSVPTAKVTVNTGELVLDSSVADKLKSIATQAEAREGVTFDVNGEIDSLLDDVSRDMVLGSFDPAALSDYDVEFKYKPLLITYTGTLSLTRGQLQELSAISRKGNATLLYTSSSRLLRVSIPLEFDTLIASYNFEMKVRGDTVEGVIHAWLTDVTASFNLDAAVEETMSLSDTDFSLNVGSFELKIYSVDISNSYKSLVSELTSDVINAAVAESTETIVSDYLTSALTQALGLE